MFSEKFEKSREMCSHGYREKLIAKPMQILNFNNFHKRRKIRNNINEIKSN